MSGPSYQQIGRRNPEDILNSPTGSGHADERTSVRPDPGAARNGIIPLMRPMFLVLLLFAAPDPQDRPLPDYETFAAQVKKHLATDEERQSGYMFTERRVQQKLDAAGRAMEESIKVFEIYPGLPGEDRYRRLIEEDGKPDPADRLA